MHKLNTILIVIGIVAFGIFGACMMLSSILTPSSPFIGMILHRAGIIVLSNTFIFILLVKLLRKEQ